MQFFVLATVGHPIHVGAIELLRGPPIREIVPGKPASPLSLRAPVKICNAFLDSCRGGGRVFATGCVSHTTLTVGGDRAS